MYSLEDGLREILTMADMPGKKLDAMLLQGRIMVFAAELEKCDNVPPVLLEIMPHELRKAALTAAMAFMLQVLAAK